MQEQSSFFTNMLNLSDHIKPEHFENIRKRLLKLSTPEPNTGCYIWTSCTYLNGYGVIRVNNKTLSAHRVSFFVNNGIIPTGFTVDHVCNNKYCVNPAHLEAKTQRDNLLRSNSISTQNVGKTHCSKGHPYSTENTIIDKKGSRDCTICRNERKKRYYAKHKTEILEKKVAYHIKNRERIIATQKLYRQNKPGFIKIKSKIRPVD